MWAASGRRHQPWKSRKPGQWLAQAHGFARLDARRECRCFAEQHDDGRTHVEAADFGATRKPRADARIDQARRRTSARWRIDLTRKDGLDAAHEKRADQLT